MILFKYWKYNIEIVVAIAIKIRVKESFANKFFVWTLEQGNDFL